jgi:hypothetical protein
MIARTMSRLAFVVGLMLAGVAPAAAQQPYNPPPPPPPSSYYQPAPQQPACPPGTHWEEAGYVSHGKYREARCARDDGRE